MLVLAMVEMTTIVIIPVILLIANTPGNIKPGDILDLIFMMTFIYLAYIVFLPNPPCGTIYIRYGLGVIIIAPQDYLFWLWINSTFIISYTAIITRTLCKF